MGNLSAAVEQWSKMLQFIDDNMPAGLPEGVGDPIFPPTRCVSILVTARDAADLRALLSRVAALQTERDEAVKAERERCSNMVKREAAGFLTLLSEHDAAKDKPEHLAVLSVFVTELVDLLAAALREPSDG